MKIDPRLFAILASGALATNTAFAAHHGHHHHAGVAAAHASGHDAKISATTGGSTNTAPETIPATDHGRPETGPAADHGQHHAATPGAEPGSKEGLAEPPIDTSITVNQGPHSIKNGKVRLGTKTKSIKSTKTTKTTGVPGVGLKYQHVLNHQQKSAVGSNRSLQRNAVGTLHEQNKMGHDKIVEHGNVIVLRAGAPTTLPLTHGLVAKPVNGNAPINKLSSDALRVVRMSGLSLSGTDSIRPRAETSALGGPAQINRGVLSGSMFHPKHP